MAQRRHHYEQEEQGAKYLPLRQVAKGMRQTDEQQAGACGGLHVIGQHERKYRQARKQGHRVVLISEGIEQVVEPLARAAKADDYVCNRLEFVDGETTGKLLEPVIGGHELGRWVRRYAAEHDLDLTNSVTYTAHGPDLLLLAAVGQPCAVNPDFDSFRAQYHSGRGQLVWNALIADLETPVSAMLKAMGILSPHTSPRNRARVG